MIHKPITIVIWTGSLLSDSAESKTPYPNKGIGIHAKRNATNQEILFTYGIFAVSEVLC